MRIENFISIFLFSLASLPGPSSAEPQQLTAVSVPSQCSDICKPIVELTGTCGMTMGAAMEMDMTTTEMMAEMDCICKNTSFDVKKIMGLCASCMIMNAGSSNKTAVQSKLSFIYSFACITTDMKTTDIEMLMSGCKFPTQSYSPSATTAVAAIKVEATKPVMTMTMWNNTDTATNGTDSTMSGMSMGAAGRLEVGAGFFSAGMIMALLGLGCELVLGNL
jgi:hypothetical protein